MSIKQRLKELGDELSDACMAGRPAVKTIRAAFHLLTGNTRVNVLSILQYIVIMLRIVGIKHDDAMAVCAHCVSRAYEVGEPFLDSVYKNEKEYLN